MPFLHGIQGNQTLSVSPFAISCKFYRAEEKGKVTMIKNEAIPHRTMRVVFKNKDTDEDEWKILSKRDAIAFAKEMSLDLILVDPKSDPPVCKIGGFGQLLMEKKKKVKEQKASQKARAMKEIFIKAGIDIHDFETKMSKVKGFLDDGHPVKLSILSKKHALRSLTRNSNALGLEETTLKALEYIEELPIIVQQQKTNADVALRRDFIITPKLSLVQAVAKPVT
jgi:translation initiation factor IF-3